MKPLVHSFHSFLPSVYFSSICGSVRAFIYYAAVLQAVKR